MTDFQGYHTVVRGAPRWHWDKDLRVARRLAAQGRPGNFKISIRLVKK